MRSLHRSVALVLSTSILALSAGHASAGDRDRGHRGHGRGHGGWNDCNDGVRWSSRSSWHSGGSSFSISIGSGWGDCYPSRTYCPPVRRVAYCPPPVTYCPPPVVVTRPVVYTPVYTQPVVYTQPLVVQQTRVIETSPVVQPVVERVQVIERPAVQVSTQPALVQSSAVVLDAPSSPATSAAEDLTRALAAASQGEDRRAIELMRAYFRIYATPPAGLVLSRPMLERLSSAYARRCELEEPSADTYFVLATIRGLLGERDAALAALDAGKAWGDKDASADTVRAWLESR